MLDLIRKAIAGPTKKEADNTSPELKTHIAAGVLLLEAALSDGKCTEEEMEHVVQTLQSRFNLSSQYTAELVEMAHTARDNALDLWQFTNKINQDFSSEEKVAVMEDVWRIIHADGQIDKHEDYLAHKMATLLHLSHRQLINAKIKARQEKIERENNL